MTDAAEIVALERAALDRWGNGDPGGFLELYADGITYSDPATKIRMDGRRAMADCYRPLVGKIRVPRYEMLNPQVVVEGHMALLTYNLVNYMTDEGGGESVGTRWNSTTVFQRVGGAWKSIHSHWSFTAHPALQNMSPVEQEERR
jgi:ketosteroid isomerase-like protein